MSSGVDDCGHVKYLCGGLCLDVKDEDDEDEKEGELVYLGNHNGSVCNKYATK